MPSDRSPRRPRRGRGVLAAAVAVLAVAPATAASAERMSIFYDTSSAVRVLTAPGGPGAPIDGARGAVRQDPGRYGIFDPRGRDARFRMGKVSASQLARLGVRGIVARLRREIDAPTVPNSTGLVGIDEIGNRFNDGRVRIRYVTHNVRGTRIRIASYNRLVVTSTGYRVLRRRAPLPRVRPRSPGRRLSAAMVILARTPHPQGGSYADRVHMYVAPAFSTSIAAGRGPHRHLSPDGTPRRATWRGVMPALARAGGVWIEMYHRSRARGVYPMTAREWRTVPTAFTRYLGRFRGRAERVHLLFTRASSLPRGARDCGGAMACQWSLARSTAVGMRLLANGPGAYRLGDQARAWRVQYNRLFGSG